MSDRWRTEKPLQQPERLPGRRESGTPAWWVCPSNTAGTHRPEAAQTHLHRNSTKEIQVKVAESKVSCHNHKNKQLPSYYLLFVSKTCSKSTTVAKPKCSFKATEASYQHGRSLLRGTFIHSTCLKWCLSIVFLFIDPYLFFRAVWIHDWESIDVINLQHACCSNMHIYNEKYWTF